MAGGQFLILDWDLEPTVIVGCASLLLGYAIALDFHLSRRAYYFVAGVVILFLALTSPLDTLADTYLFSAHMLQHILMILVVPPLLILGIPASSARKFLKTHWIAKTEEALSHPLIAWSLGVGTMWLWHWPPLYNAALANEAIHIAEHVTFLITATIFWWPVINPIPELRLSPLVSMVYVFGACTAHTVLAILITFAPLGIYPSYLNPADRLGLLPLLRNGWGLTPRVDQQWGGLLMWVPACLVYLTFLLRTLVEWYRAPEPAFSNLSSGASHGA